MEGGETYQVNRQGSRTISMGKCIPVRIILFPIACVMSGEFSDGLSCYPGYMTVCPTTPCWMGAYISPSISSWGLSLFDFLTFDTRQAGREVEDKWFKNRGILMLSQFPCALWPTQGHRIPEYLWGTGSRIPPSCRCQHPWILKVPSSWASVSTDSESPDMDSQLYLFLKSAFLIILECHELYYHHGRPLFIFQLRIYRNTWWVTAIRSIKPFPVLEFMGWGVLSEYSRKGGWKEGEGTKFWNNVKDPATEGQGLKWWVVWGGVSVPDRLRPVASVLGIPPSSAHSPAAGQSHLHSSHPLAARRGPHLL